MTKLEWKAKYRQERISRVRAALSTKEVAQILGDPYAHVFTEKQDAFIRLVHRYKNKLDASHLERIETWRTEAKKKAEKQMDPLFYSKNPFLSMIPKNESSWVGHYVPVPLEVGE